MKELVLSASVSNCFPELNSLSWKLNLDRQIRVWKVIWEWERLTSHPTQPFWWKTQAKYYVVTVTALWMPLHFGYELLSSCMCLRISSGVFVMLRFYFLTKSWYDQGWCKLLVSQYCSLDFGLIFFYCCICNTVARSHGDGTTSGPRPVTGSLWLRYCVSIRYLRTRRCTQEHRKLF